MIIGGIGGVARVGGILKTDVTVSYLPCTVDAGTEAVDKAFLSGRPVEYKAWAEIRDDDDKVIDLFDVTNLQISSNADGGGNAMLTVRNTDKWSIEGVEHAGLLRPANRPITVTMRVIIGGEEYETQLFSGVVESYSESHGAGGASISLSCRPVTTSITNRPAKNYARLTAYRRLYDEFKDSGLFGVGQCLIFLMPDFAVTGETGFATISQVVNNLIPVGKSISARETGGVKIEPLGASASEAADEFTLTDANQNSITRSVGVKSSYNSVSVWGVDELGELVFEDVQDLADIANRGIVAYPITYGSPEAPIEQNKQAAQEWLASMIRGKLSSQIMLNPFIKVGAIIKFSSERLFIVDGQARVDNVLHRYSVGAATTWLSEMSVLT